MNSKPKRNRTEDPDICWCNMIPKSVIEEAIRQGARELNEIFDQTTAGVGPCGGSCRPYLAKMLEQYLATGIFPEDPRPKKKRRR